MNIFKSIYSVGWVVLLSVVSSLVQAKVIVGDKAPSFTAETIEGKVIKLDSYQGKPINLIFLDSLCPMPQFPKCEAKIEKLNHLAKSDDSAIWLGVVNNFYVNKKRVFAFKEKFNIEIPLIFDDEHIIFKSYHVFATPYQISIGENQSITYRGDNIKPIEGNR